jgi:hypothetical protein
MCTEPLPPGVYPIAVDKYIYIYIYIYNLWICSSFNNFRIEWQRKLQICGVSPESTLRYTPGYTTFKHRRFQLHWEVNFLVNLELFLTSVLLILIYIYIYIYIYIAGLHPQSPSNFSWQPSARLSHTLRPSYISQVTAAATSADQYWHLHRSDGRNTLIYAHTTSRILLTCDVSLKSKKLLSPEVGKFVEIILLYFTNLRKVAWI